MQHEARLPQPGIHRFFPLSHCFKGERSEVIEPLGDDTAFEGECAALGGGGKDELGVGEALLESVTGSGRGGGGRENRGEKWGREGGGVGALAVKQNEGLFVGKTEGFDDQCVWVGGGFIFVVVERGGAGCHS